MYRGIIGAALTVTDTTTETLRVTAVRSEMNIALAWVRRIAVTLRGGTAITTTTVSVTVSTLRRSPSQIALAFTATKAWGNDLAIEPLRCGSCLSGLGAGVAGTRSTQPFVSPDRRRAYAQGQAQSQSQSQSQSPNNLVAAFIQNTATQPSAFLRYLRGRPGPRLTPSTPYSRYTSFTNRIEPVSLQRLTAVSIIFSSLASRPLLMYVR